MARSDNRNSSASTSQARGDRAVSGAGKPQVEEDLSFGQSKVHSMAYNESLEFSIEGDIYDAWMPRIARSADGLVPVLPIRTLDDGAEGILIVPGSFNSWIRKEKPGRGTKLRLIRKWLDENTGAWRLAVVRL